MSVDAYEGLCSMIDRLPMIAYKMRKLGHEAEADRIGDVVEALGDIASVLDPDADD